MKIALCTPSYTTPDYDHLLAASRFLGLARDGGHEVVVLRTHGCAIITHARSEIATDAFEMGCDVLLWIDNDIVFDPEEALGLCLECSEDRPIIGAACPVKTPGGRVCVVFLPNTGKVTFGTGGGIYQAESIGMGLTATHRSVFEKLSKFSQCFPVIGTRPGRTIHPFFQCIFVPASDDPQKLFWSGEDFGFCFLAREVGCTVWCDTRIATTHKGIYGYTLDDAVSVLERHASMTIDFSKHKD